MIWLKAHCDSEALRKCLVILSVHLVCGIWLLFSKRLLVGMSWESQYETMQTLEVGEETIPFQQRVGLSLADG